MVNAPEFQEIANNNNNDHIESGESRSVDSSAAVAETARIKDNVRYARSRVRWPVATRRLQSVDSYRHGVQEYFDLNAIFDKFHRFANRGVLATLASHADKAYT